MPKMKPHRGAKKRFRVTRNGKIMRRRSNVTHYLEGKPGTRRRRLQREAEVHPSDRSRMRKLLGGG